jgi:hypothetical protein
VTGAPRALLAGLMIPAFLLAVNIPSSALVQLFGHDDVLRLSPGAILLRFHERQGVLAWVWLAFAAAALAFASVAAALNSRPRKTLGWRTLAEALDAALQSAQSGVATTG